jgi:hypothetical protein
VPPAVARLALMAPRTPRKPDAGRDAGTRQWLAVPPPSNAEQRTERRADARARRARPARRDNGAAGSQSRRGLRGLFGNRGERRLEARLAQAEREIEELRAQVKKLTARGGGTRSKSRPASKAPAKGSSRSATRRKRTT